MRRGQGGVETSAGQFLLPRDRYFSGQLFYTFQVNPLKRRLDLDQWADNHRKNLGQNRLCEGQRLCFQFVVISHIWVLAFYGFRTMRQSGGPGSKWAHAPAMLVTFVISASSHPRCCPEVPSFPRGCTPMIRRMPSKNTASPINTHTFSHTSGTPIVPATGDLTSPPAARFCSQNAATYKRVRLCGVPPDGDLVHKWLSQGR